MIRLRWASGFISHQGNVRERNEDAALDNGERGVWAVADGMGGHERGDLASALLIERLSGTQNSDTLAELVDQIVDGAESTNAELINKESNGRLSGTTMAALAVKDGRGACVWVGDSRVYRFREGKLLQMTKDHSEEQDGHVLTRAIGADRTLQVDVREMNISNGDHYVLCSDGLYQELKGQQIADTLTDCATPQQAARRLVDIALEGPCDDNVTALVIEFEALES